MDQGVGTIGYCRYRQAVPVGIGGRLDVDTNFGLRKSFLPQVRATIKIKRLLSLCQKLKLLVAKT